MALYTFPIVKWETATIENHLEIHDEHAIDSRHARGSRESIFNTTLLHNIWKN